MVDVMEGEWATAAWERASGQVGAPLGAVMEGASVEVVLVSVVAALAVVAFMEGMWEFSPTTRS